MAGEPAKVGEEGRRWHQHCAVVFAPINQQMHRNFAKSSDIFSPQDWLPQLTLEENFLRSVPTLLELNFLATASVQEEVAFIRMIREPNRSSWDRMLLVQRLISDRSTHIARWICLRTRASRKLALAPAR